VKAKHTLRVSVEFEKHQPERRRQVGGNLPCNGGCCCCSCCLHSLGGLIGAAAATAKGKSESDRLALGAYWFVLSLLTLAAWGWASSNAAGFGIVIVLVFLPILQLAASLVTFFWIQIRSASLPDKKTRLRTLGRITFWSFMGALFGLIAMVIGFALLH
jgi:hypothetical protein